MLITIPENARQDAFYRLFNPAVRFKTVGYVDKSHIDRHSHLRRDKRATVEALGLAHTTARRHTVNGMADAFFRNGYKKLHTFTLFPAWILRPDSPQRVGHNGMRPASVAKKTVNGYLRTQSVVFP